MGLFEYIKQLIQDAIERNNTGSVSKGETKGVCGGAVYDAVKNKADKAMPYLQYLNNNVATDINKYQIINKFDSEEEFPEATALPIANTTDMNKHRFLFVELFYDVDLGVFHTMDLLASVMLDANSLSEFEYTLVDDSTREVDINIYNGNLNVYFEDKGEIYEKNEVTDYYLTVRLVD